MLSSATKRLSGESKTDDHYAPCNEQPDVVIEARAPRDTAIAAMFGKPFWHTRRRFMPTRNVVLTNHQAEMVDRLVTSGQYQNASEVLREGLRLVEHQEAEARARLKALREAVRVGIADADAGRFRSFGTRDELKRHLSSLAEDALAVKAVDSTRNGSAG